MPVTPQNSFTFPTAMREAMLAELPRQAQRRGPGLDPASLTRLLRVRDKLEGYARSPNGGRGWISLKRPERLELWRFAQRRVGPDPSGVWSRLRTTLWSGPPEREGQPARVRIRLEEVPFHADGGLFRELQALVGDRLAIPEEHRLATEIIDVLERRLRTASAALRRG